MTSGADAFEIACFRGQRELIGRSKCQEHLLYTQREAGRRKTLHSSSLREYDSRALRPKW